MAILFLFLFFTVNYFFLSYGFQRDTQGTSSTSLLVTGLQFLTCPLSPVTPGGPCEHTEIS